MGKNYSMETTAKSVDPIIGDHDSSAFSEICCNLQSYITITVNMLQLKVTTD